MECQLFAELSPSAAKQTLAVAYCERLNKKNALRILGELNLHTMASVTKPTSVPIKTRRNRLPTEIPGPRVRTRWGRLKAMSRFSQDSVALGNQLFAEYGPLATIAHGGGTRLFTPWGKNCPGSILVRGPELLKEVATKHDTYHKFHLSGVLHPHNDESERKASLRVFASGLFGVNGDDHRRQRKMMAPAFIPSRVATYADAMVDVTERMTANWRCGQMFDIAVEMRELAREIASVCLFGESLEDGGTELTAGVQTGLALVSNPLVRLLPYDLPGLPYRKLLEVSDVAYRRAQGVIARRRAEPEKADDVLSMLLKARDETDGAALTEDELIGHVNVLFAAGHETSANALTWTCFLLSQHPEIYADLVEELQSELKGETARPIDFERLPLLDRVIKESMRVITPVPWNGRVLAQDAELGGFELPAGTEVMGSIYHTHHMPEIFTEPERFHPDRFAENHYTGYEYNPFSAGQRICIGAGFAMQEIKIVLSHLLQKFRLEYVPEREINRQGTIVIIPKQGMLMRLERVGDMYTGGVGTVVGNVRDMVDLPTC